MAGDLSEEEFEDIIVRDLTSDTSWEEGELEPLYKGFDPGGYRERENHHFDTDYCLIPEDVLEFVKKTQPGEWEKLENFHGDDAEEHFLQTLDRQIKKKGGIDVLRNGLRLSGARFEQLAYFKPATDRNKKAVENYEKNIFSVIRQLRYKDTNESVDLAIFLNGIPIFTSEVKGDFTGQDVTDAKTQYKVDRDPRDKLFRPGRCLAHFAVDPEEVYMTTELDGQDTNFLPFNKGHGEGAGNPPNPSGYRTSYFWKYLLSRDSVLDIVQNFISEFRERDDQGDLTDEEFLVFPRYHQLQAVRRSISDVERNGTGKRYLIQHSAGSGKTFTISWLAHQLAEIHNDQNNPVFDSVIVISDRRVLDDQLQHHLKQFSQVDGVVANVEENSKQLKKALESGEKIIVSTIHKFDYIVEEMEDLSDRNFAVLIDEAHSSQTGELKDSQTRALSEEGSVEDSGDEDLTVQERLSEDMEGRGVLSNVSSFAFTATPKEKTLEMFGEETEDGGYEPFSLYSMRQAIEEGFILDVLQNYTTYQDYFNLLKTIKDNPEFEESKAKRLLKSFVDSHDLVISKKTEIIVEHFVEEVMHRIDGKAKAMVVTGSREQVVKYKRAFDKYISDNSHSFKALAAFSPFTYEGEKLTEKDVNKNLDTKIEDKFEEDDSRIIIVANKFQTGFDQPLLHTMYVDKQLGGVRAVQTLSRLNRTHPDKEDTMVVDFKNDPEDIQEAFERFYTKTRVKKGTNPQLVYDLEDELREFRLFKKDEVEEFTELWYSEETDQDQLSAVLDPVKDRYEDAEEETQDEFRKKLKDFIQLYSFLIKVVNFRDEELHKLYQFSRVLYRKLPVERGKMPNEVKQYVDLDQYHIKEVASEEDRSLEESEGELGPTHKTKDAPKKKKEEQKSPLENIVDMLNQQFGYEMDEQDKTFIKHLKERLEENTALKETVEKNNAEKAQMKFQNVTRKEMLEMIDQNTKFFNKATNDDEFAEVFQNWLFNQFVNSSKEDSRDLIEKGRGKTIEFEEHLLPSKESDKTAKQRIAQHICGFANTAGGHLILGVDKEGNIAGLEKDFKSVQKGQEGFQQQIHNALSEYLGETFASQKTEIRFNTFGETSICVIKAEPSDEPIRFNEDEFYIRDGIETQQLSSRDTDKYIKKHFR